MRIPYRDQLYVLKTYRLKGLASLLGVTFRMRGDAGTFLCRDYSSFGQFHKGWEKEVRMVVSSMPRGLFLDVGANIGTYSVLSSKLGNMVIAVEPNPRIAELLRRNLALNGCQSFEVVEAAAWNKCTTLNFYRNENSGQGSVVRAKSRSPFPIRADTLDSVLGGRIPTLVKLDVEGAELEAIRGLSLTLAKEKVPIIFEALDSDSLSSDSYLLEAMGYKIKGLDETNYLAAVPGSTGWLPKTWKP